MGCYSRPSLKRLAIAITLAAWACVPPPVAPPAVFPLTFSWVAPTEGRLIPPLATDGVRVFAAAQGQGVRAFDPGTGAIVWRDPEREGALSATPGALYLREPDGLVWRLDPTNGAPLWSAHTGVAGELPPALVAGRLVVAGEGVAALDPGSGRSLWEADAGSSVAPPAGGAACVLLSEADGSLRCRNPASGTEIWRRRFDTPLRAAPVLDDSGRVLVGTADRQFVALRARDGKQLWRWKLGADVDGAPVVVGDEVVFASFENVLWSLRRGSGNLAWREGLPTRPLEGPRLLGPALIVATRENQVLGFDARSGRRLGQMELEAELQAAPIVVADLLVVGLRDRTVAALAMNQRPLESELSTPERGTRP